MSAVTITRHYSGFRNVADKFSVGNHEADGNAAATDYGLPIGYKVDAVSQEIVDPDGYVCEIIPHSSGRPQLISRAGKITAQPVLAKHEAVVI